MNVEKRCSSHSLSAWLCRGAVLAFVVGCLTSFGCANGEVRLDDPFDRKLNLEQAQHRYTVLVRWGKFQEAKVFVGVDDQAEYLKRMKMFKEARFTDYESDPVELDHEKQVASISVVYNLYLPNSPFELEITEVQEWTRNGISNAWEVYSIFEPLDALASN